MAEAAVRELKLDVRKSFARAYSALKARELQTIRQIEAVWKQCGDTGALALRQNNINISFDNESILFEEIKRFGAIDFNKLNLDSDIFIMEDYVSPNEDHVSLYKSLDEIHPGKDSEDSFEAAIEEDAIKQITNGNKCVCTVNVSPDEISRKFRDDERTPANSETSPSPEEKLVDNCDITCKNNKDDEILVIAEDLNETKANCETVQKANPTQDWLNQIITETETEPSQVIDFMEHSAIECS